MMTLIDNLVAALDTVRELIDADEAIPNSDPRPYDASKCVEAAGRELLAARFPGRQINAGGGLIGYDGSTYFEVVTIAGDNQITVRLSGHKNTSRSWSRPAANIIAGCDASDIEMEMEAAAEELAAIEGGSK